MGGERGASNAALNAEAPVGDKVRQINDARRETADKGFKDNLRVTERLREEQRELEEKAAEERAKAMMDLADFFENTVKGVVDGVAKTAVEVKNTAESMASSAHETSERSTAVAAASEEATTSVKTVATAATELSSSISEISQRVGESSRISDTAAAKAQQTNAEVAQLAEAGKRIGNVVGLISDIAEQANLLALNATIQEIASALEEQGAATGEISRSVDETAAGTLDVTQNITAVSQAAGESGQSAGTMLTASDEIRAMVQTLLDQETVIAA